MEAMEFYVTSVRVASMECTRAHRIDDTNGLIRTPLALR